MARRDVKSFELGVKCWSNLRSNLNLSLNLRLNVVERLIVAMKLNIEVKLTSEERLNIEEGQGAFLQVKLQTSQTS